MSELGKSVHITGPLIPGFENGDTTVGEEFKEASSGDAFAAFMDKTLQSHGDHSILYVCGFRFIFLCVL